MSSSCGCRCGGCGEAPGASVVTCISSRARFAVAVSTRERKRALSPCLTRPESAGNTVEASGAHGGTLWARPTVVAEGRAIITTHRSRGRTGMQVIYTASASRSIRADGAGRGPAPEIVQPLLHRARQRPRRAELAEQNLRGERGARGIRRVQAGDDRLFHLRSAEAFRGGGKPSEIEGRGILLSLPQVNLQDGAPRFGAGQIDKEDLVEAALPDELRWQLGYVVRRRDDEDVAAPLLEPRQEGAKDAPRYAAVVLTGAAREGLFQLVDPEDDGREPLRRLHRALEVLLAITDVLVVEIRRIELEQRQSPFMRDRLGAEALAASGHAEEENAFRKGEAELRRPLRVGDDLPPFGEPRLEAREPGNVRHPLLRRPVLQQAVLLHHLPLRLERALDVGGAQVAIVD